MDDAPPSYPKKFHQIKLITSVKKKTHCWFTSANLAMSFECGYWQLLIVITQNVAVKDFHYLTLRNEATARQLFAVNEL